MRDGKSLLYEVTLITGLAFTALLACNKNDSPPPDITPAITSFTPAEAAEGATVVITGNNFRTMNQRTK